VRCGSVCRKIDRQGIVGLSRERRRAVSSFILFAQASVVASFGAVNMSKCIKKAIDTQPYQLVFSPLCLLLWLAPRTWVDRRWSYDRMPQE
jgi:hypothetical protein